MFSTIYVVAARLAQKAGTSLLGGLLSGSSDSTGSSSHDSSIAGTVSTVSRNIVEWKKLDAFNKLVEVSLASSSALLLLFPSFSALSLWLLSEKEYIDADLASRVVCEPIFDGANVQRH